MSQHYWCFLSYSHKDESVASWLSRAIEGYRVPPQLVGQPGQDEPVPKLIRPVFRDRDELPATSDLGGTLRLALDNSRVLVVLCSPDSARSPWVEEEIRHFKRSGRSHRVLAVIVRGRPHADNPDEECFPEALRFPLLPDGTYDRTQKEEPIAPDLTAEPREMVLLRVIAGVLGIEFDALRQRHRERQKVQRLQLGALILAVLTAFAGLWSFKQSQVTAEHAHAETQVATVKKEAEVRISVEQARKRAEQGREHLLRNEWAKAAACLGDAALALPDDPDVKLMHGLALLNFRGQQQILAGLPDPGTKVTWSDDGSQVAAGDSSGHLVWWDAASGQKLGSWVAENLEKGPVSTLLPMPKVHAWVVGTGLAAMTTGPLAFIPGDPTSQPKILHAGSVPRTVALSPDGSLLVAATVDFEPQATHRLRSWSMPEGTPLPPIAVEGKPLIAAFLPDGQRVALATDAGAVFIFDLKAGKQLNQLEAPKDVCTLFVQAAANRLWVGSRDVLLQAWNLTDFAPALKIPLPEPLPFDPLLIPSPRQTTVFLQAPNEKLMFDLPSAPGAPKARESRALPVPFDFFVSAAAFSPGESQLLLASTKAEAALVDAATGEWVGTLRGHEGALRSVAWAPDGKHLATCGADRKVILWDASQLKASPTPPAASSGYPATQAWWCGEKFDHIAFKAQMEVGIADLHGLTTATITHPIDDKLTDMSGVAVALHPLGTQIATGGGDATVRLWEVATQRELRRFDLGKTTAWGLAISPDGHYLIASTKDRRLLCWDLKSPADTAKWELKSCTATSVVFNADGDAIFASGSTGETAKVVNTESGKVRFALPVEKSKRLNGFFDASGLHLIVHGADLACHILAASTGQEVGKTGDHVEPVRHATTSPDGKTLATLDSGGRLRLWQLPTGTELGQWQEPQHSSLHSLRFSPDSHHIAVGALSDLFLISLQSHEALARFFSPNDVNDLQYSPDGHHLLVAAGQQARPLELAPSPEELPELSATSRRINPYSAEPPTEKTTGQR